VSPSNASQRAFALAACPKSGGDAARYFDPQEVESIARVVEDVWKNAPAASKAQAQSRRFNYLDSAAELLEALRKPPSGREIE